jgi:UDP-GlcNAc:undecaprenyl-phosphate GlcNAc-1-phosphate transferase
VTSDWPLPLLVAGAVGLVGTPVARRLALTAGFVDRPGRGKSHRKVMPYGGGVAIAVATACGWLAGHGQALGALVIGCASVLVVIGLLDDDRPITPVVRFVPELACGAIVLAAGVELAGVGVGALAGVLTVLLLAGSANALNLLDNLDGLAAGVTAAGTAGVLVLSVLSGDRTTVATSASLLGACLAFLVFNARPASIFMGDAGSLFLGFVFAALAIRTGQSLPQPAGLLFPLLVLALPIADSATVVVARLRNGRSPIRGGRDHLSHRLARLGLGEGKAVGVLIAVEGVLSALAVASARGAVALWVAAAAGLALVLVLVTVAGRVRVYRDEAPGLPRWFAVGIPAAVVVAGALAVPAVLGALAARGPALAGESAARAALADAEQGHLSAAASEFATAHAQFAAAQGALEGPLTSLGLAYPVLSTNLAAARAIAAAGVELSAVGQQLALATDTFRFRVKGGAVPVAELAATRTSFEAALGTVSSVSAVVGGVSHVYLLPQVVSALGSLESTLRPAVRHVQQAYAAATYLPGLLGLGGPQRYFLAMQTDSESRATGGLIGFYGILVADQGHLRIEDVSPIDKLDSPPGRTRALHAPADYLARYAGFDPADLWQNVNMSPDFPTVAAVIRGLYPESGGVPVDGVVALDPVGLAGLLQLTGPVTVPGWPAPISAGNVVPVLLSQSYITYGSSEAARQQFLAGVVRAVFKAVSNVSLGDPRQIVDDLAPAVAGLHIQVWSSRPAAEAYLASLGLAGALPPVRSDFLELTSQNAAGNKIDWYLRRALSYRVEVTPQAGGTAMVTGELDVSLDNTAPGTGLPASVIGPYQPGLASGENRSFVTVYTPLDFSAASEDGRPAGLDSTRELGRYADSTFVDLPPRTTGTLRLSLVGQVRLLPGRWYELDIGSQPLVFPDTLTVRIDPAPGWVVTAVSGATLDAGGSVTASLTVDSLRHIRVQLAPAGQAPPG